jgi:hypothetical protein
MQGLILHRGAVEASLQMVLDTPTPAATKTWCPIAHGDLLSIVEREMTSQGLEIADRGFGLSKDGARMFGVLSLRGERDYTTTIGVRNSHDMTFPACLALGARVFVCDNLSFSSEVTLSRKHTVNVMRDLPALVSRAVARLSEARQLQGERIEAYKGRELSDYEAHDLFVRALDRGVCPVTRLPDAIAEWRKPSHDAFAPRNVWSLFNGFTEALKGNLGELPRRTQALHGLCDQACGLALQAPALA